MAKDDNVIQLTKQDLADLVSAAVTAALASVKPAAPPEAPKLTPDAIHERQVARGEIIEDEAVPCRDPRTGYTFVAHIQRGKVTSFTSESLPDEIPFPKGMNVRDGEGRLTMQAKQWVYTNIRRPVLDLSGSPLPLAYRLDAQAQLAEAERRIAAGL